MFWTLALARQQSSVTDHNVIAILLGAKAGPSINPNVCGGGPLIADAARRRVRRGGVAKGQSISAPG